MARSWPKRVARLLRHRVVDERSARRAIPPDALARLTQRVRDSEARHSGEIRVYVEAALPTHFIVRDATPRDRAISVFAELRTWDTAHNNGVLIYLLLSERAIEIVADRGVTAHVPDAEWRRIVEGMRGEFRSGRYEQGLAQAIDAVTQHLVQHFALAPGEDNPNELPDEPVLG